MRTIEVKKISIRPLNCSLNGQRGIC